MREKNRIRMDSGGTSQPIPSAVDHDFPLIHDQKRTVHPVPLRTGFDFTAGAEKLQNHSPWNEMCSTSHGATTMGKENRNDKRESGLPGGGAGRKDDVGHSGVYPMSGPHPPGEAPIAEQAGWGQGTRGPAGFEDHGESEIIVSHTTPERCRDIMSKDPVCCLPNDSTETAAQLMREHDTGILPVVSNREDKKLLGVVTDRDIAMTVVADACDPRDTRVESIMSWPPFVVSPGDPYAHALQTMERNRIRRVPVVDRTGRVVGIISQADIALRVPDRKQTGG